MNFREHIKKYSDEDTPLGDLVNDILSDRDFVDAWDIDHIQQYLSWRLGHDERVKMVDKLVREYKNINPN